jgi:hypothetical protein
LNNVLSGSDLALLQRVRHRVLGWQKAGRWGILIVGGAWVGVGLWMCIHYLRESAAAYLQLDPRDSFFTVNLSTLSMFPVLITLGVLMFSLGVVLILFVAARWKGNPADRLLLAIADSLHGPGE